MKKKLPVIAIWLTALIVAAAAMLIFESDLLWKIQEKNLFLDSRIFLNEQMVVPGGFLTWIGTWFTQFLYYPWLGVVLLCGWWLLMMTITKRAFRIPDRWATLMLIPVALLLITNMDQGYWIYFLKLRGHFFVSTIGATAVAALLWAFRSLPEKYYLRTILILLTCVVGYPLMGIYGLAAALLMGIWTWRLSTKRTEAAVNSIVAVLCIVAVPLVCYRYIYYQTNLVNIYWAELPLFFLTEEYHTYYIPYYILLAFFVVLAVLKFEPRTSKPETRSSKPESRTSRLVTVIVNAVVAVMLVAGVYTFWMKDENYHHELAMQHRIAELDWEGVLDEAAKQQDEPTRAIVMMRNLALSRLGRQANQQFLYRNGSKAYDAPFGMRLMMAVGPLIYYQYGMLNYCNRLCIEMGVEFGFRVEDYKLLLKCAILQNDKPLARKYSRLLKQTTFYSKWAEKQELLLGHPDLIAKDPELEAVSHMLHYEDYLGGDQGNIERFLMNQLANSSYAGDPVFQEQALLATFWTKDIRQFWRRFYDYIQLHPNGPMPRYYQEAAYLYGKLQKKENLDKFPFDKAIKQSFENFMSYAINYDDQDIEIVRQALYPTYGQTYFYEYYTMRQLPEY